MGSSGSSRFSDYPDKPAAKVTSGGGRGGIAGGSSGTDRCDLAFSAILEDFEHSEYFQKHAVPPKVSTRISIAMGKRVYAKTSSGMSIGNLPTKLNYLAACIANGRTYTGQIVALTPGSVVKISIEAAPK